METSDTVHCSTYVQTYCCDVTVMLNYSDSPRSHLCHNSFLNCPLGFRRDYAFHTLSPSRTVIVRSCRVYDNKYLANLKQTINSNFTRKKNAWYLVKVHNTDYGIIQMLNLLASK